MALKKMTGLTGLAVCKDPGHVLDSLYGKILRVLEKFPESSSYRRYTEEIVLHRATIVARSGCREDIEEGICCGQAEQLILQAEKELLLSRNLLACRPWEPLVEEPQPDQWIWPPAK